MRFIHKTQTVSTNIDAHDLAAKGPIQPLWIRADYQTDGKGRMGREWVSPIGNLYASGLFSVTGPLNVTAQLSFVAALAIADTVSIYAPNADISLKWPNDVLVGGAKISGILLETGQGQYGAYAVVGIGLNIEHHPNTTIYPATHLLDHMGEDSLNGPEPLYTGVEAVLATLAARFEVWRKRHSEEGFAPLREAWLLRAHGMGERAIVAGEHVRLIGLGVNGELQVERESGTIDEILAGDVFFPAQRFDPKG